MELSTEEARRLFHYDPETGILRWAAKRKRSVVGSVAGTVTKHGYVRIGIYKKPYMAHRVAWLIMTGDWPKHEIDHIDGDRKNNKWENLRDIPTAQNRQNQKRAQKNNKSGFLGVIEHQGRYRAVISLKERGGVIYLGSFDNPFDAHAKYLSIKRKLHKGCTI